MKFKTQFPENHENPCIIAHSKLHGNPCIDKEVLGLSKFQVHSWGIRDEIFLLSPQTHKGPISGKKLNEFKKKSHENHGNPFALLLQANFMKIHV